LQRQIFLLLRRRFHRRLTTTARALWDHLLIRRGIAALGGAEKLGGALGAYTLPAAIAACHARARTVANTDWTRTATSSQSPAASRRHAWRSSVRRERA